MKNCILSLVLLTMLVSAALAQRNEQSRPPIIDVHLHAYEKDERWTHKTPTLVRGSP